MPRFQEGFTFPASILNNAQHSHIHDNTFVTNVKGVPSLDELYRRVAPNAILNAGGRADDVRCHPGTRQDVIDRIEKWADDGDHLTAPILWLSGPAGAGKSAIMQTIAERRDDCRLPEANFFFFRGDNSRSHATPLVATLLHQIVQLNPSLQNIMASIISNNPLIFDTILEVQLEKLIFTPLCDIRQPSSVDRPLILLIDGLDECDSETKDSQQRILLAFDKLFIRHPTACPVRLLVASRDEPQIQVAFNTISSRCVKLYLDDQYSPASDIRVFVKAQFSEIKKTHRLGRTLAPSWPSVGDVNYIVRKSSGQFIFAATVMRFILGSSASPALSLDRVKGAEKFATRSPFPHLDAIYTYILSQAEDQATLSEILKAHVLLMALRTVEGKRSYFDTLSVVQIKDVLTTFDLHCTEEMVCSCLQDLTSLAEYTADGELLFHHASFYDYILDQSRSGNYFVDIPDVCSIIAIKVWKQIEYARPVSVDHILMLGMCIIGPMTSLPPGLMNILGPKLLNRQAVFSTSQIFVFLEIMIQLGNLCICTDDEIMFRYLMREWLCNAEYLPPFDTIKNIRFSRRYFQMARAQNLIEPSDKMVAALRPECDFDRHELTWWLSDLLHLIHKEIYHQSIARYKRLLQAWISWAVLHSIPLNSPRNGSDNPNSEDMRQCIDLPYCRWAFSMAHVDYHHIPNNEMSAALRPQSNSDREESALWLNGLLDQLHREVYHHDAARYKGLLEAWIFWAVENDVLNGLVDLDNRKYIWRRMTLKWAAPKLKLGGEK